ncbi:MAG: response regulator [Bacteroidetes bacterium]|nr:response regulator [Bacteroidota bacterium]
MKRALLICLLFFASYAAFAQNNKGKPYELPVVFRHLNRANGLASNIVNCILQDRNGFMWFGTDKGLNRYDGRNFDLFIRNPNDSNSLSGNNITALYEDRRGRIWIGTNDNGITIYDPITEKFKRYEHDPKKPNSINTGYVAQIYEDNEGRFWICLYGGGLELFDESRQTFIHHIWRANDRYTIASIKCTSIYEIANGKYFVGTFEGGGDPFRDLKTTGHLNYYDLNTNQFHPVSVGKALVNRQHYDSVSHMLRLVYGITPDSSGNVWLSTFVGILKYNLADWEFESFNNNTKDSVILKYNLADRKFETFENNVKDSVRLSNNIVRSICPAGNKIYIGTEGGGINVLNTIDGSIITYKNNPLNPSSLSDDFIKVVYKDKDGRIWIGTIGGGINIIDPPIENFVVYPYDFLKIKPTDRYGDVTTQALCPVDGGKILVGSQRGVRLLNTHTNEVKLFEQIGVRNGKEYSFPSYSISPSKSGHFWISMADLIYRYNTKNETISECNYRRIAYRNYLPIQSIVEKDDSNLIVIFFDRQASIINLQKNTRNFLVNNVKPFITKDKSGNIWCSLYPPENGNNIVRISSDYSLKYFSLDNASKTSVNANQIRGMFTDSKNCIWVWGSDWIDTFDRRVQKFILYKNIKKLPDNNIVSLTEDGEGNIWFATKSAVIKMDSRNDITAYEAYRDLPVHKIESQMVYDKQEDAIYFAANEGLVKFYPKRLLDKNKMPPVHITGFKLFNKAIQTDSSALVKRVYNFNYDQNFITINFNVLNYTENVVYNYAYKLVGLNDDWIDVGNRYEANFTNLQPGTYVFKVRASTRDGKHISESQEVKIVIATPWWQSWWFYAVCFVFVIAAIYAYNKYRTNAFMKRTKLLESQVAERTSQYKEQKEKAETSERLRQQFLANMSHEIRTPMNAVNSFVHLLMEKDPKPEQVQYLNAISKSSDLLLHIINDVLDISKMEVGKLQLEKIPFSLKQVVSSIADTLSVLAEEKKLQIQTVIADKVPDMIEGDPYRLSQILLNLCSNSIKFTEKGYVRINVDLVEGQNIKFSVADTGIGVPPEKLKLLFRDFAQVNISDTRKHGGTGLGLSISKGLVTLMGGNITAESIPSVGSSFSFTIPLQLANTQQTIISKTTAQKVDGSVLNGLRILVVDDNEYNRLAVIDTLNLKANVMINIASNGQQALDLLHINVYDIILMDAQMPIMSGIEATKHIRANFPSPKNAVPIIAMTASVQHAYLEECLAAGMNTCVTKPFNALTLIREMAILTGKANVFPDSQNAEVDSDKNHSENGIVTNLAGLREFCEDNEARMHQYISLYLKGIPAFCNEIEASLSKKNYETIKELVHAFKPKCAMMGMKRVLLIANKLEANENHFAPEWEDDIRLLLNDIRKSVTELTKYK